MQSIEEQFPPERGYKLSHNEFKFHQGVDHIRFDVDTTSVPDGCVTGVEPTNAKVQKGNQQYVALSFKKCIYSIL